MKINVTQADLEESVRGNTCYCAVATRIGRDWQDVTRISVRADTIRFSDPARGERYVYNTPDEVREYIRAYDEGKLVAPFSFTLKDPQVWPIAKTVPGQKVARQTTKARPSGPRTSRQSRVWGAKP